MESGRGTAGTQGLSTPHTMHSCETERCWITYSTNYYTRRDQRIGGGGLGSGAGHVSEQSFANFCIYIYMCVVYLGLPWKLSSCVVCNIKIPFSQYEPGSVLNIHSFRSLRWNFWNRKALSKTSKQICCSTMILVLFECGLTQRWDGRRKINRDQR